MSESIELPMILEIVNEAVQKIDIDKTKYLILYKAEEYRKKPSLFRKTREELKHLIVIKYPLLLLEVLDRYAIVVDPRNNDVVKIDIYDISLNNIIEYTRILKSESSKEFINKLHILKAMIEELLDDLKKKYRKTIVLNNILRNRDLLNELETFFSVSSVDKLPGYTMELDNKGYISIKESIEKAIYKITSLSREINELNIELDNLFQQWKNTVLKEYSEKQRELEKEFNETKKVVDQRISHLRQQMNRELTELKEQLMSEEKEILDNIKSIEGEIKQVSEKLRKSLEEESKVLRKKINQLEKRKKDLEKQLNRLNNIEKGKQKQIENKYNKLIETELQRLKLIENDIKDLNREKEETIMYGYGILNNIKKLVIKLNDVINNVNKQINSFLIPLPPAGHGIYYMPIVLALYSNGEENYRVQVITPMIYRIKRGLMGRTSLIESKTIREYIINKISNFIETVGIDSLLKKEYDLLNYIDLDNIEEYLKEFADDGLINNDKYRELRESISPRNNG